MPCSWEWDCRASMRSRTKGEESQGVGDAIGYIAALRQADDKGNLPVGRRVAVIGGGMTAIDIAIQTKLLGAEDVTILYRRGPEQMKATSMSRSWRRPTASRSSTGSKPTEDPYRRRQGGGGPLRIHAERMAGDGHRRDVHASRRHGVQGDRPDFVPAPLTHELGSLDGGRIKSTMIGVPPSPMSGRAATARRAART